jgi:hypothetical protein
MPLPVSLKKVVDQVDQSIEGYQAFINRRTGELFGGDVGLMDEEDGDETLPSWMRREGAKLNALSRSIDWLPLPDDEYRCESAPIIQRFCKECCAGNVRRTLLAHLRRRMSVGLLKAKLVDLGLYDDWAEFRRERIEELVATWLTEKGIAFRK